MPAARGTIRVKTGRAPIDRVSLSGTTSFPLQVLVLAALLSIAVGLTLSRALVRRHAPLPVAFAHSAVSHDDFSSLPLAAQGPISAVLGAHNAAYHTRATAGGFQAGNPAQRLHESFSASTATVRSGKISFGLSLRAAGYGKSLQSVRGVPPTAGADRVTYAHRGVTEWYRNGPIGLEQGFTVIRPLAAHPTGPLTLALALSGNAQVTPARDGRTLLLTGRGTSLRYGDLIASDARGRQLRSWLALAGGRLLLHVDAVNARYPLRIDPLIQQGKKITQGASLGFGGSVALSSDGNTALIGAPETNSGKGMAFVFTRSGSTWTVQAGLRADPPFSDETGAGGFGSSVALSSDGNTALIGAALNNNRLGAAWVVTRSGSTWTEQQKLTGGAEESGVGFFGYGVALSSDGHTALIGGLEDNSGLGAVWVFTRSGSTWTQQGKKLTGAEETGPGWFGNSIGLSSDGNTALIGGVNDNPIAGTGAAWVFTRSGSTWTQQGKKLTGGAEESGAASFGGSVALSSDGNTALIGGDEDNQFVGAAWVFTRSGSTWTQQGKKLTGGAEESGKGSFGRSVSLSSDGNTALIGVPEDSTGNQFVGAAWVFTRSGSTWTQQAKKLTAGEESGEAYFGGSVALSPEANTALIGGPEDNSRAGAVWAFVPACLSLPSTSTWNGHWSSASGHSGVWTAALTSTQADLGNWHVEGNGEVEIFGFGRQPGRVEGTLTCTGPTTDEVRGRWTDGFGDNVTTEGTLSINSSAAVESGTWKGPTIASPSDSGTWTGEFHPTTQSNGAVPGTVEVESSSGTLINSLQTKAMNGLPLLPSGDFAPVGNLSFAANLPIGATIKVKLTLPPGSNPTGLLKLVNGVYQEVPSAIVGDTVEFAITDGAKFDEDHTANGEVIDPVIPVGHGLHVETTELPTATRGTAYSTQLAVSGGTPPYKWKKVGKLPKGLKLTKNGIIQGAPSSKLAPGSYPVGVEVSDSEKPKHSATAMLTLKVN
jgi:Putative Ig domain/FG-GAP repeat